MLSVSTVADSVPDVFLNPIQKYVYTQKKTKFSEIVHASTLMKYFMNNIKLLNRGSCTTLNNKYNYLVRTLKIV